MMNAKRKFATLVAGMLIIVGGLMSTTPAAHASGGQGYVYAPTPVYKSYWSGSGVAWYTSYNAWLWFDCWRDSPYPPYDRFFRLGGNAGWIKADHVYSQPSLGGC